jgi:hypothetical protein
MLRIGSARGGAVHGDRVGTLGAAGFIVERVATVLVIACPPCAGPRDPARHRDLDAARCALRAPRPRPRGLEKARRLTTVVFEKTGTLTLSEHRVVAVQAGAGVTEEAAGVLRAVGHPPRAAVGAILMSLSTVIVAVNAQLLRRAELRDVGSGSFAPVASSARGSTTAAWRRRSRRERAVSPPGRGTVNRRRSGPRGSGRRGPPG